MGAEKQYIDLFAQSEELINVHSAPLLNEQRSEAMRHFAKMGFPDKKSERYRYTDVEQLFAPDYGLNLKQLDVDANPYEAFKCDVPNMSTALYFIVNDSFYETNKVSAELPEGVLVGGLKDIAEKHPEILKKYYAQLADVSKDPVTAFNTAFAQDGFCIYVPKGVVLDKAIQLVSILRSTIDLIVNRRILIILEENAQARLLVCDHTTGTAQFLSTQVVEVFAADNAKLELYEIEETSRTNTRISNMYIHQAQNSSVHVNGMTLTNGTTRNTVDVQLVGRGAEVSLAGIAIEDTNQHVDNHTYINHKTTDCTSRELYKYVLNDFSTGAFTGRVVVSPGAQRTLSQQTNNNLCLSKNAKMYAQPQLEIYADDVKCGHGATTGQLDEAALFYMQQRGISQKEARMLLMFAFVNEVIDTISMEELKERLHYLIEKRFRGELNKCGSCSNCKLE
ncbi:MAG: Fe-S cluster assembly protein SufD [Bacteroidaceae bacterium]|nr:Fe-S cluster assembly protein SufD [Bacteroidaceae bacterium]